MKIHDTFGPSMFSWRASNYIAWNYMRYTMLGLHNTTSTYHNRLKPDLFVREHLLQSLPHCPRFLFLRHLAIMHWFSLLSCLGPYVTYVHKTLYALIEFRKRLQPLTKDPDTEMPQSILDLVRCMLASWDREDLVQLFQSESWKQNISTVNLG